MKRQSFYLVAITLILQAGQGLAATLYVDVNNTKPVAPYVSWDTAAQTRRLFGREQGERGWDDESRRHQQAGRGAKSFRRVFDDSPWS